MKQRKRLRRSRVLLAVIMFGLAFVALSGCNMVKGIGEDISAISQGGQDIIDDMGS